MPEGCCVSATELSYLKSCSSHREKSLSSRSHGPLCRVCGREGASSALARRSDRSVVIHFSFQQLFIILISILPSTTPHTQFKVKLTPTSWRPPRPKLQYSISQIISILNDHRIHIPLWSPPKKIKRAGSTEQYKSSNKTCVVNCIISKKVLTVKWMGKILLKESCFFLISLTVFMWGIYLFPK